MKDLAPNFTEEIRPEGVRLKRSAYFLLFILAASAMVFPREERFLVQLTGPSVSKHFHPYGDQFNNFHLGLGVETYFQKDHWLIGGNSHFMFNDSNDRTSYWIGIAPGYLVGDLKKIWGSLAVIIGGLKKAEYNQGIWEWGRCLTL